MWKWFLCFQVTRNTLLTRINVEYEVQRCGKVYRIVNIEIGYIRLYHMCCNSCCMFYWYFSQWETHHTTHIFNNVYLFYFIFFLSLHLVDSCTQTPYTWTFIIMLIYYLLRVLYTVLILFMLLELKWWKLCLRIYNQINYQTVLKCFVFVCLSLTLSYHYDYLIFF